MLLGRNIYKNFDKTTIIVVDASLNVTNKIEADDIVIFYDKNNCVASIVLNNCDYFRNTNKTFYTLNNEQFEYISDLVKKINSDLIINNTVKFQYGKITKRTQHPKSDKLFIIDIFNGEKTITLVTNTLDSQEDKVVVFAHIGAQTFSGIDVKMSELIGVKSPGMLVGYNSLGLSGEGLIFGDDSLIGQEFQI
ncbi:TyrS-associated PheT N-terminal domain-related protein TapR [Mycoplasmopsis pullorum]|uniref:tRNA-binding domain-containing protein n=1 Tax=Mycoplasmopsis pullorum TaxID=48003 RepID=A0A1L4FRP3_9BACT|nr:hypothetical protein [Mycoplasmopsis pullorum]APJ38280.1 hypothetical protein BLA55_01125 [Mycoplasmopsis pullorum]